MSRVEKPFILPLTFNALAVLFRHTLGKKHG